MAIINAIKCARCDRKYSGVRSRCPFCGARRTGSGKQSNGSENINVKMLISIAILSVFTIAAGMLLLSTPEEDKPELPVNTPSLSNPEDDIHNEQSYVTPTPTPSPEPTPEVPAEITSIEIRSEYGSTTDISLFPGERIALEVRVRPESVVEDNNMRIAWESSNTNVFEVVPVLHNGRNWKSTISGIATEPATATLTVTIGDPDDGGKEYSITIRYRAKP